MALYGIINPQKAENREGRIMVEKAARAGRLLTAAELLNRPEDGHCYELARGELRKMAPAGMRHGNLAHRIDRSLSRYVEDNDLGELYIAEAGYLLGTDPDTVRVPDLSFIRRERVNARGPWEGFWPGAPDLAVEILSPTDRLAAVAEKAAEWLAAGAGLVIVVTPRANAKTVTVHQPGQTPLTLTEQDTLEGGSVVPGWRLPVRDIFA